MQTLGTLVRSFRLLIWNCSDDPLLTAGETYDDRLRHRRGNPSPVREQDGSLLGNGLENGGLHMAGEAAHQYIP